MHNPLLLKNIDLYAPEHVGLTDLLILGAAYRAEDDLGRVGLVVKVEKPGVPYGLDCQIGTALYDADGRLLDTKFVAADSSEDYTFTFSGNDKAAKVKLFVFEASSGFKPIYQASQTLLP